MSPATEAKASDASSPGAGNRNPGLTLGIETSTPWGGAALIEGGARRRGHVWACARTGYSRRLMPAIDFLLREAGRGPEDVSAIGVTVGPGSFTGVRIGVVTAKTLAQSLGVPLYTFSTLEALAQRWPVKGEPIAVMLDARRGEIYSAVYRREADGSMTVLREPAVEKAESFVEALREIESPSIWVSGDALEKTRPIWEPALGDRGQAVNIPWCLPGAESVARMTVRAVQGGLPPTDPLEAVPDYLRASDAIRGLKS